MFPNSPNWFSRTGDYIRNDLILIIIIISAIVPSYSLWRFEFAGVAPNTKVGFRVIFIIKGPVSPHPTWFNTRNEVGLSHADNSAEVLRDFTLNFYRVWYVCVVDSVMWWECSRCWYSVLLGKISRQVEDWKLFEFITPINLVWKKL